MATKSTKRQLRARNKAKAARVKKQQGIERNGLANTPLYDWVHVQEPLLSFFETLPELDDDFNYLVPIVDYSVSRLIDQDGDPEDLIDDVTMLAAIYINMKVYGSGGFTLEHQHELFVSMLVNPKFMDVLRMRLKHLQDLTLEQA
ncbi:hypothetical protein ACK3YF_06860 [Aeromonas allosaccharophila]|uniref:hypothetical protein n=1 Tax=Aeromonas allosaccharophila TaxID=656 RepID=UPI003987041A